MWLEMFVLLVFEGLVATSLYYLIGAAIVRNLFWPKITAGPITLGYLFAVLLTPIIAMAMAADGTWNDASDRLMSTAWMSAIIVLVLLALFRLSHNAAPATETNEQAAPEPLTESDVDTLDAATARQLMSIKEQVDVGLLSAEEGAARRAALLQECVSAENSSPSA